MRIKALISVFLLIALATGLFGLNRNIFIFDGAGGSGARFEHPDHPGDTIRPYEGWVEALDSINSVPDYFVMRDNLIYTVDVELPAMLNADIVILSLGWQSTGAAILDSDEQRQLIALLDSTSRDPGKQTALFIEGNDFAKLYCDTATGLYADSFADYTGAILLLDNAGPVSTLFGEDSSLAEDMAFDYRITTGGPCTSMDDIVKNDAMWDSHHLKYLFNASRRSPARGLQRRSYSPGAVITLPFQFGNIPRGPRNSKEELLVRMLDFAIMPLVDIVTDFSSDTLYVDSLYNLEFEAYDNRCVKHVVFEYSSDAGTSWLGLNEIPNPALDTVLSVIFSIPPSSGTECLIRVTVTDSTYNFTSDTSASFVAINAGIDEEPDKPDAPWLTAFPNPFNSGLTFVVKTATDSEVDIYNLNGDLVGEISVKSGENRYSWKPGDLPTGVYMARIRGSEKAFKAVYLR